jgi:ribonuclease P protein component
LSDSGAFVELLRGRRKAIGALELAVRDRPGSSGPGGARVGIVVGRKNLPRAVDRNALKRIVREAFRSPRAELPPRDMLFRLRQRIAGLPRDAWKSELESAVRTLLEQSKRPDPKKSR